MEFLTESTRSLAAEADNALTIGAVGREFNIENDIVKLECFLNAHTVCVFCAVVQNQNAVRTRALVFNIVDAEFRTAAEHSAAQHTAHLCGLYFRAVRKNRAVQRNGNLTAFIHISRIGNDNKFVFRADIDIANAQPFRIRVLLNMRYCADNNVADLHFGNDIRNLESAQEHF